MADTPNEAPVAPEAKSEATPNTNPEPAKEQTAPQEKSEAPDMHGFTSEQLADMQKFFQANGGYDKVKSKISNPSPTPAQEQKPIEPEPAVTPKDDDFQVPEGSITRDEYFASRYYKDLASEEKYAAIADQITSGEVLKEMAALGIQTFNQNGTINNGRVRQFLDLKAKTVPAKQTSETPEASAAPTVDYIPVGDKITDMNQATQIIRQDSQLRARGLAGHPSIKMAEDFLRETLNKGKK